MQRKYYKASSCSMGTEQEDFSSPTLGLFSIFFFPKMPSTGSFLKKHINKP